MRISKNLASLNVYRNYKQKVEGYSTAMERISSGTKINKAKDDPNKMAQSERMRLEIRSYGIAAKNVQDSISMIQTNESGLENIQKNLNRVRELVIKAKGGTNDSDREIIKKEIQEICGSIDDLAKNTEFNGKSLIRGDFDEVKTTIGGKIGETLSIPAFDATTEGLGLSISGVNQIDLNDIDKSLDFIDNASKKVVSAMSKYGATENRLMSAFENSVELKDRVVGIESKIRDTDIAFEIVELSKNQILIESGNALMAQTNKFPQEILRVLENVRGK